MERFFVGEKFVRFCDPSYTAVCMTKKKAARKVTPQTSKPYVAPEFLVDLLNARSPTGHEYEAQAVVDRQVEPVVDEYRKDTMGNRFATVNPNGDPSILFTGHID